MVPLEKYILYANVEKERNKKKLFKYTLMADIQFYISTIDIKYRHIIIVNTSDMLLNEWAHVILSHI